MAEHGTLRRVLLACGIAAPLLYVAMLVLVPMGWETYSSASQTVSELSAIGAPMGFAAAAFEQRFRLYSIATMVLLIAFGSLTSVDAPRIQANLPTPWIGVWERIDIGVWMSWLLVLAVVLLRRQSERNLP